MGMFDGDVQELQSKDLTVADYIHSPIHILVGNPTYSVEVFTAIAKSMNLTGPEFLAKMQNNKVKILYRNHTTECTECDWSNVGLNREDTKSIAIAHGMHCHSDGFEVIWRG